MKRTRLGQQFTVCAALGISGAALGCAGAPQDSTASSSSGGVDAGECGWNPTVGSDTVPDCSDKRYVTILQGTVDGMPYNETFQGTDWTGGPLPVDAGGVAQVTVFLPALSYIHAEGYGADVSWQFVPVPSGWVRLPGDGSKMRTTHSGSLLRFKCNEFIVAFILDFDGGHLVACSRP
jgi:hypothetical protein